jgi:hypothetical protein
MMKGLFVVAASCATLAGCATTAGGASSAATLPTFPDGAARHLEGVDRELAAARAIESPPPEFPRLTTSPRLPSADRLRHRLQAEGSGLAAAQVKLCVVPSGAVAQVSLQRSSGMPLYDQAVLADVPQWRYQSYPAPATIQVCQLLTVAYLAR